MQPAPAPTGAFLRTRPRMQPAPALSGCVSPHKATNEEGARHRPVRIPKIGWRNLRGARKVARPLLLEGPRNARPPLLQSCLYPLQRPQRLPIDALRDHYQDAPAVSIKPLTPFQITAPLLG